MDQKALEEFRHRVDHVRRRMAGHWDFVLRQLLLRPEVVNRKPQPCPRCNAGTDRFSYDDKYGNGDAYCRKCDNFDGFDLLEAVNGWTFAEAFREVERLVGGIPASVPVVKQPKRSKTEWVARKVWSQTEDIVPGSIGWHYLANRGIVLETYPERLRFHPNLEYYEKDEANHSRLAGHYPALVMLVEDAEDKLINLYRHYLTPEGLKAPVADNKKPLMGSIGGGRVRLFDVASVLGVGEGLETCLAGHLAFKRIPVWPALSAGNLEKFSPPKGVEHLVIFADLEASFQGLKSAFKLAWAVQQSRQKWPDVQRVSVGLPRKRSGRWEVIWISSTDESADFADYNLALVALANRKKSA